MDKHTPGPWEAVNAARSVAIYGPIDGGCRSEIARLTGGGQGATEVRRADAWLIAAAPDMLAVLLEVNEHLTNAGWHTDRGCLMRIRDAIAKAAGVI